jgi:non-ribosomal peptide synthetase component F
MPALPSAHATDVDLARIAQFNRTDAPFPDDVTLHELLEAAALRHRSRTAVVCEHDRAFGASSLTYAELNDKVNQLAHRLRAEGVRRNDVVALMVERSFAMIVGIFAIIKAGAAYLPLSPDNPPDRNDYVLKDAGA